MKLVAYFSASGVTRRYAEELSKELHADLFEIKPEVPYSTADLDWTNNDSRSSREMKDVNSRPDFISKLDSLDKYDELLVGFPVWWYTCPHIIDSFFDYYDLSKKDVKVFFTSGSTGEETIKKSLSKYDFISSVVRINNNDDLGKLLNDKD